MFFVFGITYALYQSKCYNISKKLFLKGITMSTDLNIKLFSAADSLRSKMDASEYKDYLLGLIFYKYLSDKQLLEIVKLAGESIETFNTQIKQTELFKNLLEDEDIRSDLIETLESTLNYMIEPPYLFNVLADQAKQNTFQ